MENRVLKVMERCKTKGIETLIVSDPISIFYLTGIHVEPGERLYALQLSQSGKMRFFMNRLFPIQAPDEIEIIWHSDTDRPVEAMAAYLKDSKTIGIDKNWPARFLLKLMEAVPQASYVNGSEAVDSVRMRKDDEEQRKMAASSSLNDRVMEKAQAALKEGMTELEMVEVLRNLFHSEGATFSFQPIVCFGENAANPHHENGNRKLKEGDAVILDIGGLKDHYCSDMTRTLFFKKAPQNGETIYNLVKEANLKAIEAVKPGVRFCDIDKAARRVIEAGGYGPQFLHRTGHSIGLEVHDYGDVSSVNEEVVKPGMIFSIEPGIYLEGRFGVRIEDLVLVTKEGCKVLNKVSKDLRIIER